MANDRADREVRLIFNGDGAQIEGRCHRDGRLAQVYWTYADTTIEERIARIVAAGSR